MGLGPVWLPRANSGAISFLLVSGPQPRESSLPMAAQVSLTGKVRANLGMGLK